MKRAILLSGGMDSYALAYLIKPEMAITIDYGQIPAKAEIQSSRILCDELSIKHHILTNDLSNLGSGDLFKKPPSDIAPASDWWPFRNQMLITLAGMYAIKYGIKELLIGCVNSDANHIDGTKDFINLIDKLINKQEGNLSVSAPAIEKSTEDLIRSSNIPFSTLAWSHSCHISNLSCGTCRGCIKHKNVTDALGLEAY